MEQNLLIMKDISKFFPGVKALNNVNIDVKKGEVLALVGENGAGKSTLMKVLSGIHKADSGTILFSGAELVVNSPLQAKQKGISIIHQELNVMKNMSITENIFVGTELRKGKMFVDEKSQRIRAKELLNEVGLDIDPETIMARLSIASQQMVEIAKALAIDAELIIMDEPTSSLTERETKKLFEIVRQICKKGKAVIYISHRMEEIFEIADRVTVLRDGQSVGTMMVDGCTRDILVELMVGRALGSLYQKSECKFGDEILRVENISTEALLNDVSFSLRKGEVLGFSGLVGAGRTELMRAIFGLDKKSAGNVYVEGKKVRIDSSWEAISCGIAYVSEDRKRDGLILGMSVKGNIALPVLKMLKTKFLLDNVKEENLAQEYVEKLKIKTPSIEQLVQNLSGGNQQKIVISKWLAVKPKVLILDEPTRGVDVGAKKEIHTIIDALAQQGIAIIVISSELLEVLGVSDRILVMRNGQIKGELLRSDATQVKILHMAVD